MPAAGRYQNLHFNGDERKYEMWEARFLGYMLMKGLKDTINATESTTVDASKNEQAYGELIQWLDERSMSLVVRVAKDKGREALIILRNYYRGTYEILQQPARSSGSIESKYKGMAKLLWPHKEIGNE